MTAPTDFTGQLISVYQAADAGEGAGHFGIAPQERSVRAKIARKGGRRANAILAPPASMPAVIIRDNATYDAIASDRPVKPKPRLARLLNAAGPPMIDIHRVNASGGAVSYAKVITFT